MYGETGSEEPKIELRRTTTQYEFYEDAVPTFAYVTLGVTGDIFQNVDGPVYTEWDKSIWGTYFTLESGDTICLNSKAVTGEVFTRFELADRYIGNISEEEEEYGSIIEEEPDFSRTLEALTVYRGKLYVIAKETKAGTDYRVLKVMPWLGLSGEIDVTKDVLLDMATGVVEELGFVDGHIEQMAMKTDDGQWWTINLRFDYFYQDIEEQIVLLRHSYSGYTPYFIEY
jgi:hypothetical protein